MKRTIAWVLAAIVGVWLTGMALTMAGYLSTAFFAPWKGWSEAEVQIESASSRISRYEHFFELCAGIQAKEQAMDAVRANDAMAESRQQNAIASNQSARGNLIAQYNSESAQDYTSARFKDSDLPWDIPNELYTGNNKTQCR